MENDDKTEQARERALHLAAEVAETDDRNVPVLLLQLKDILDLGPPRSSLGTIIRIDLWTYDVIHVCNLALKQDFAAISGGWDTATQLGTILCQSCVGLKLPEVKEYEKSFLPDVVDNVLTLAAKLLDFSVKAKVMDEKKKHFQSFRSTVNSLEWLYSFHAFLAYNVLQSKRFVQILMSEDVEASLFILLILENIFKTNRLVMDKLEANVLYSILDEIVFKISASEESSIGRASIHLILTATNIHPPLVEILLSKRYRGLKAYLSKWKARGFDNDVKRLVSLLEAGSIAQAEQMRLSRAATVIQAFYRGSKQRQRLNRAEFGIILLQRKFRQNRLDKARTRDKEKRHEERKLATEQKRINEFRSSMRKQLKMLESVPAREVNLFMAENQVNAASKIQAVFRGMMGRRKYCERRDEVSRERAAVTIQRQFRRYQQRLAERKTPYPVVPGLTDSRRAELQNTIAEHRQKYPAKHRTQEELKELHEKAFSLLANHVLSNMKIRKSEQRRDALLARLNVDTDQLLAAPKLHEVTPDILDSFTSRSAPVIARAQQCHNEEMRRLKLPWWKKLWDEQEVDGTGERPGAQDDEQLNF
ncbi:IQ calmodulin-binding motif-containing protein [Desmophyllum pertusum]|uniref:IQ calmodulin-binding motif-containing protein n=1 Tax=Desmophyllum pertusum TaxID=174260 RepID=A0A9W9YUK2_9CNID|nr:IQ calmodulin-binding motif-containing protein [Desmophyllum pertusum]